MRRPPSSSPSTFLATSLLLLAHSHRAAAFFRLALGVLVTERADPIISPGGISGEGGFVLVVMTSPRSSRPVACLLCLSSFPSYL